MRGARPDACRWWLWCHMWFFASRSLFLFSRALAPPVARALSGTDLNWSDCELDDVRNFKPLLNMKKLIKLNLARNALEKASQRESRRGPAPV